MSNAFVGTVCLDNVSDSDDLPNMNQVGPDHIRAILGLLDHSWAKQKDCVLTFHAIYKCLISNRSEKHW